MKNIKSIIFLATLAFCVASCNKEELKPTVHGEARTIYGAFEFASDPELKSTLAEDGCTPLWAVGDQIKMFNESGNQIVTIVSGEGIPAVGEAYITDDDKVVITTDLTGQLYGVYPAEVAVGESCPDGKPAFIIPGDQDGSFAGANICVAKLSENEDFIFKNAAAIFKFSQTAGNGVKALRIKSASTITGKVTVSFTENDLNFEWTAGASEIRVFSDTELTDFYVAMPALASVGNGIFTGVLTISALKEGSCGILKKEPGIKLQRNKIYRLNSLDGLTYNSDRGLINGHEYVEVAGMRWATENLAITESGKRIFKGNRQGTNGIGQDTGHVIGDFFQWAGTDVNYKSFNSKCIYGDTENSFNFKPDCDFTHPHSPFYDPSFATYLYPNTGDHGYAFGTKKILIPADDAATVNWGAPWRIPGITAQSQDPANVSEFKALREATVAVWDKTDQGHYIFKPVNDADKGKRYKSLTEDAENVSYKQKADAILFFPSPGYVENSTVGYVGDFGCYWTNCVKSGDRRYANVFRLCGNNSYEQYLETPTSKPYYDFNGSFQRWRGASIRAVAPIE